MQTLPEHDRDLLGLDKSQRDVLGTTAVHTGIRKIRSAVTCTDLPRSTATLRSQIVMWDDTTEGSELLFVVAVFAGQKVQCFRIPAVDEDISQRSTEGALVPLPTLFRFHAQVYSV